MPLPQPDRPLTFAEKLNIGFFIASLLSLTLLPFLRRRLGFRLLSPLHFIPCLLLFLLCNPLIPGALITMSMEPNASGGESPVLHTGNGSGFLGLFAFLSMMLASRQRAARRREMKQGIPVHSFSRGISVFAFLPCKLETVHRTIEPLFVIVIGFWIWDTFSPALGWWLVVSGLALTAVEARVAQIQMERTMDAVDGMLDSGTLSEAVAEFQRPSTPVFNSREIIQTGTVPKHPTLWQRIFGRRRP